MSFISGAIFGAAVAIIGVLVGAAIMMAKKEK